MRQVRESIRVHREGKKTSVPKQKKSLISLRPIKALESNRSGKKSKKVNKEKSTYRLYIQFSAAFVLPREHMNYYSNIRFGDEYELKGLLRRVLYGSCAGKYKLAMLFHQSTGKCLSVWVPGQAEMSYENYLAYKSKNTPYTKSLLTALLIYKRAYKAQIVRNGGSLLTYIYSSDYDPVTQQKCFDIALRSLLLQLTEGQFKDRFHSVITYHGEKKHELGRISAKAQVTCSDADFRQKIHKSSRFCLSELGVYIMT